jgi:3-oxoacyl-[acyl-carrier protein] reductase
MDLGLNGKTALVLGASSGIGEAVALALAREGASLALAARDTQKLDAVARMALAGGAPEAIGFFADVEDEHSLLRLLDSAQSALGAIDIAVLNGGGPRAGRFTEVTLDDWDSAYRLLLRGTLTLVENLIGPMRERRWGRIVALTSSSVKQPIDNLVLSNGFRTALVATLRTLATEVAADGVTVNCIATGRVETRRLRSLYGDDASALARAAEEIPMRRIASPEEFAPLVAFLCGEPARYVTGQTISIDGGLVRGLFG